MNTLDDVILAVWADIETTPLGLRSRLLDRVAGTEVLRRTARRISEVSAAKNKIIFCPSDQADRIRPMIDDLPIDLVGVDIQLPPFWGGIRAARKWAKGCWRGGLMGACSFDEDILPTILCELVGRYSAQSVVSVPAAAVLVDPEIIDRQIEQHVTHREEFKITFTQAPPGVGGVVLTGDLTKQLVDTGQLAGSALAYHPNSPKTDFITRPCNLGLDPSITQTAVRLLCDHQRGFELIDQLLTELPEEKLTAERIVDWVKANVTDHLARWPEEIEIELISGWPTPRSYRPSPEVPRGPIDAERLIERVAQMAGECDDLLVCLGGFGEPTRHPEFARIVKGLKDAGVWSICLATTGLFDEKTAQTIAELPIDIVQVMIDVPDAQLYQQVTGHAGYEKVLANIDHLLKLRHQLQQPLPLIVPEMIKTAETMELMEEFFKTWISRIGWAVIRGYSDYAGQLPDRAVSAMAPPQRCPCRRLFSHMMILADANVTICDQDFQAKQCIGSIETNSLIDLWQGTPLTELREAHRAGTYNTNDLCPNCRYWHRH